MLAFDRDHGYFDGALAERFARAIDRGIPSADDCDSRAQLYFGGAHADVAQERKSVEHAFFVLALGTNAIGLGEADGQNAGVVIFFQIVPADVLADFDVRS